MVIIMAVYINNYNLVIIEPKIITQRIFSGMKNRKQD